MTKLFVVVSGPPGSGKTTLAARLAPALGLPLLAKDTIKEALMTVLPVPDVAASQVIGRASVAALYGLAAQNEGAVLDSVWHRRALPELRALPAPVVEVHCQCARGVALERYRSRQRAHGHFDAGRSADELWNAEVSRPVAGGWPVITADTNGPVDLADLVRQIAGASRLS